jgi:hypothetical protein
MKTSKLTLMQAALGLAAVASAHTAGAADQGHRLQEDPSTYPAPVQDALPILIEGIFVGRELHVRMPDRSIWKYLLPEVAPTNGISRTFTVMVNRAFPKTATVFQPTAEGIHPYIGTAERFAVEAAKDGKGGL